MAIRKPGTKSQLQMPIHRCLEPLGSPGSRAANASRSAARARTPHSWHISATSLLVVMDRPHFNFCVSRTRGCSTRKSSSLCGGIGRSCIEFLCTSSVMLLLAGFCDFGLWVDWLEYFLDGRGSGCWDRGCVSL